MRLAPKEKAGEGARRLILAAPGGGITHLREPRRTRREESRRAGARLSDGAGVPEAGLTTVAPLPAAAQATAALADDAALEPGQGDEDVEDQLPDGDTINKRAGGQARSAGALPP